MVVLLNIRVNCSLFASKPAHFSGHLPLGSPIMSFLLFALPCFSCKDAPLTGSCVPKPGVETRHPRFVRRDDTSPLRGTRALNWPAMAARLQFMTASVRAGLFLRSLLTHFLGGPSTSTARSIKGGEGEVTLHQIACRFSLHIACLLTGRLAPERERETRRWPANLLS